MELGRDQENKIEFYPSYLVLCLAYKMYGAHGKLTSVVDDERWGEGRRRVYRSYKTNGEAIYMIVGEDTPTKK